MVQGAGGPLAVDTGRRRLEDAVSAGARAAVTEIVGGDAGTVRRAVRSLLRAGLLEASECGRVRLSRREAFGFRLRALAGLLEEWPDGEGTPSRGRARGTPVV